MARCMHCRSKTISFALGTDIKRHCTIFLLYIATISSIATVSAIQATAATYDSLQYDYEKIEDTSHKTDYVSPGWGGQGYDVEYLGMSIKDGKLYFAIQSGYNFFKSGAGDLMLDFGNDGDWDYAISFDSAATKKGAQYTLSLFGTDASGLQKGTFFKNPEDQSIYYYQVANNKVGKITNAVFSDFTFTQAQDAYESKRSSSSYLIQAALNLSIFDLSDVDTMALSWTMYCGNDVLKVVGDLPPAPVPEPATMLLFGSGLIGFAGIARRRLNR